MPADVNKTVSISYKADMKDLFSNLKKIPGMTEEEAKKMVKALDKQLKATEKAAQKAAKGTTRAMKQIDNSAKRSAMSARSLRKEFANIDRLTSEASQGLALVSPAMGEAAAQASVAASGIESLGRALMVSNPLFIVGAIVVGGIIAAFSHASQQAEALKESEERLNKELESSEQAFLKLIDSIEDADTKIGGFSESTNDLRNKLLLAKGEISEVELQGIKNAQELHNFEQELLKTTGKRDEILQSQAENLKQRQEAVLKEIQHLRESKSALFDNSEVEEKINHLKKQRNIIGREETDIAYQIRDAEKENREEVERQVREREKVLEGLQEQREREERIKKAQKRRNDRLKEFSKLLKETLKPLKEAEKLIAASTQAREKSIKSLQKQDSTRQKIAMTALKEELKEIEKRLKENEKNTNLSELQVTRENERLLIQQKQNTLKAIENLQIEGLRKKNEQVITQIEKQITEVHKRQNLERTILETARAELEAQKQIALQTKNKSERTEKIKQIEEAFLKLKTDEAAFNDSLKTDEQTLITLQESKVQAALNGYEQIQNAIKETGELEKETFLDIVNTIQESIGIRTSEILGNVAGIHDASQKLATAQIDLLQQQIDNVAAARDKHLERIDEAEKKGIITAEQAAKRKEDAEKRYAESVKDEQIRMFKTQQAAQIAQAIMDAASASARAFKDYPFPVSLGVAGLAAAAATMRVQQIKAQKPPQKFDMGGMIGSSTMSPDMGTIQALKGEAILDRATVNNIGGEQGIQALQNNSSNMGQVVVIQPFKHFDKFVRTASRNNIFGMKKSFSSKY